MDCPPEHVQAQMDKLMDLPDTGRLEGLLPSAMECRSSMIRKVLLWWCESDSQRLKSSAVFYLKGLIHRCLQLEEMGELLALLAETILR